MLCSNEFPLIISPDVIPAISIPKFIKLKNLPISPKYRVKISNSLFDENSDTLSDLEVVEFPFISTPPPSPAVPNMSPRRNKEVKKMRNALTRLSQSKQTNKNQKKVIAPFPIFN